MSDKELSRLEVIQKTEGKLLKRKEAADLLGLSTRQIIRLVKKYREQGPAGLLSRRRGQTGNRRHTDTFKKKAISLVAAHYPDFGPTFAAEKLEERNDIKINKETLRQWMIQAGLWKGKQRRSSTAHPQRERRPCFGELVQIDGSPHDWFEGRAPKCCLIVFIDDATSRLLQLRFEPSETTQAYYKTTRAYIERYGRPVTFYSDKHSIFRVNHPEAKSGTGETQFGRAMRELGIETLCASTAQAKGRVERANQTLQDRLVKELRLRNINDIESANAYLPEFIAAHNQRFAVGPTSSVDVHRQQLPGTEALDLIFSFHATRKLSKNLELSYNNVIYQIKTKTPSYNMRHATVTVCDDKNGHITLIYKNKLLEYSTLDKKRRASSICDSKRINQRVDQSMKKDGRSIGHKPAANHPWRQYDQIMQRLGQRAG